MRAIIETKQLTKKYGNLIAVNEVSLSVKRGEVFGLLGPNGAGKTTLISMLVTTKAPTSGSATINGFDISSQPDGVRRSIGIVFQDPSLDEELTAYENLELHAAMYGVERNERQKRIAEVIKMVELEEWLHKQVKTFSGGMRRRLEIARSLIHYPKVLFLDEPTLGLDPQTRQHVWTYVKRLKEEHGITILLTTHYMDEADQLCDRIAIIDHGRIIALGSSAELKNSLGGDIITVETSNNQLFMKLLGRVAWVKDAKLDNNSITLRVKAGETKIPELVSIARKRDIIVTSISLRKPSLDDVFLNYTGRIIREEGGSAKERMALMRRRMHR